MPNTICKMIWHSSATVRHCLVEVGSSVMAMPTVEYAWDACKEAELVWMQSFWLKLRKRGSWRYQWVEWRSTCNVQKNKESISSGWPLTYNSCINCKDSLNCNVTNIEKNVAAVNFLLFSSFFSFFHFHFYLLFRSHFPPHFSMTSLCKRTIWGVYFNGQSICCKKSRLEIETK